MAQVMNIEGSEKTRFVTGSASMNSVVDLLHKVASLDTSVLLTGESGTGKELAAHLLHEGSPLRSKGPMISVHCGAIPDSLLESELFGHVKGAFTGAVSDHQGKFEQADGGTLFLDEISTMKPEAQIRLLRVLQTRTVTRLGAQDREARPINVRVVAATNQNLKELVDRGEFRLDLYYRINTFPVAIPALRERPTDIPPLVEHFSERVAEKLGLAEAKLFGPDAMRALAAHDWPGNVRELENAVEYASIMCEREVVTVHDLPAEFSGLDQGNAGAGSSVVVTEEGLSLRSAVSNLERELILQSLRLADGNKARAAELLELKRTTFLEKLRRLEQDGLIPAH